MESLKIYSNKQSIIVKAKPAIISSLVHSDFGYKYIPSYGFSTINASDNGEDKNYTLEIIEFGTGDFKVLLGMPKTVINVPKNIMLSNEDIFSIIDYIFEYLRNYSGHYAINASCCAFAETAIVMFGPVSGIGKTSLNLRLCLDEGAEFIADEKVLIDSSGAVITGNTKISFNKPDLIKFFDESIHDYDAKSGIKFNFKSTATNKTLFIQPIILPNATFAVQKWEHDRANWHLYEELTRKIRGISRRVADFSYPLESIDNSYLANKRTEDVGRIVNKHAFYSIKGDIRDVAKYIRLNYETMTTSI